MVVISPRQIARFVIFCACAAVVSTAVAEEELSEKLFKEGQSVRRAFREVVADARQYTVQLTSNGKTAAYGLILESDGWVLTKASSVSGLLKCRLPDGRVVSGFVVAEHPDHDLALVKIDAEELATVVWTDKSPAAGAWLATTGIGPLPVGVGILSVGPRAIPRQRGVIGIQIGDTRKGPVVVRVLPGSGAEQAGLRPRDIVTHLNDEVLKDRADLIERLQQFRPGDDCRLRILRLEAVQTVVVQLTAPLGEMLGRGDKQNRLGGDLSERRSGFPNAFQHDTTLTPEQCGGPVVDLDGKTVGLNIARYGRTASLALPASTVRELIPQLKSGKFPPSHPAAPPPPLPSFIGR